MMKHQNIELVGTPTELIEFIYQNNKQLIIFSICGECWSKWYPHKSFGAELEKYAAKSLAWEIDYEILNNLFEQSNRMFMTKTEYFNRRVNTEILDGGDAISPKLISMIICFVCKYKNEKSYNDVVEYWQDCKPMTIEEFSNLIKD